MISIEQCRKKLEKYGRKFYDEQILESRDTLYQIAKHQLKDLNDGRYDELTNVNSTFKKDDINSKLKSMVWKLCGYCLSLSSCTSTLILCIVVFSSEISFKSLFLSSLGFDNSCICSTKQNRA